MKKFRYIIAAVFVVAVGTVMFLSCEKENVGSDDSLIKQNSIERKSTEAFIGEIPIELIGIIDDFIINYEEDIEFDYVSEEGICYGIIITDNADIFWLWRDKEMAAGKEVRYIDINGLLYIGISWTPKNNTAPDTLGT
ncbi:MAG: hypothetical protein GX330_08165 [Bacteroidales bacterium]|nr:hypothetical protein [Bacteroidales bacterium]